MTAVGVVACGALAQHLRAIADRRGFDLTLYPLPPLLHNQPSRIPDEVDALLRELGGRHARLAVAYADCGTYGALDDVLARHEDVARLPGLHCYELYAGALAERLSAEEPGTYFLTDFLVRAFDVAVVRELGLDRHPELRDDYFRHYRRVVWLAQQPTPELHAEAERAAARLGLPLELREVGEGGLEAALEALVGAPSVRAGRSSTLPPAPSSLTEHGGRPTPGRVPHPLAPVVKVLENGTNDAPPRSRVRS